jgi:hypothetical protein
LPPTTTGITNPEWPVAGRRNAGTSPLNDAAAADNAIRCFSVTARASALKLSTGTSAGRGPAEYPNSANRRTVLPSTSMTAVREASADTPRAMASRMARSVWASSRSRIAPTSAASKSRRASEFGLTGRMAA